MATKRKTEFEIRADATKLAGDLRVASETLRRTVKGMEQSASRSGENVGRSFSSAAKRMESSFSRAAKSIGRQFDGLRKKLTSPIALAVGGIGAGFGVRGLSDLALTQKQLENIGEAVTGSRGLGAEEIQFATRVAEKYGLALNATRRSYLKLLASAKPANFAIEESRDIFESVSIASAALGLSMDETRGAFRAIEQIMSKGTVQAEELRGQLGERLPGAFSIAARAMGVTTEQLGDMLKKGQVLANDFLPKFANELEELFGGAAQDNAKLWNREFQRIKNSFAEFLGIISGPVFETLGPPLRAIRDQVVEIFSIDRARSWGAAAQESILAAFEAFGQFEQLKLGELLIDGAQQALAKIVDMGFAAFTKLLEGGTALLRFASDQLRVFVGQALLGVVRQFASELDSLPLFNLQDTLAEIDNEIVQISASSRTWKELQAEVAREFKETGKDGAAIRQHIQNFILGTNHTNEAANKLKATWNSLRESVRATTGDVFNLGNQLTFAAQRAAAAMTAVTAMQAAAVAATNIQFGVAPENFKSSHLEYGPFLTDEQNLELFRQLDAQQQKAKEAFASTAPVIEEFKSSVETATAPEPVERFTAAIEQTETAWNDVTQTIRGGFRQALSGNVDDWGQFLTQLVADIAATKLESYIFDDLLAPKNVIPGANIDFNLSGGNAAASFSEGFIRTLSERPVNFEGTNIEAGAHLLLHSYDEAFGEVANGANETAGAISQSFEQGSTGILGALQSMAGSAMDLFKDLFSGIAKGFQGLFNSAGGGSGFNWSSIFSGLGSLLSFEGGGFTGFGVRAGGVDGSGGYPAILHPGEVVADLTKGGLGGTVVNQTLNIQPGVSQEMIPQILAAAREGTLAAIRDQGKRGGRRARELGF